jgi:hypothetical protein
MQDARVRFRVMEIPDRESLGRFARDRHVHYEVAPEEVQAGDAAGVTAFQVRLFATPGEAAPEEAKLGRPASERSTQLLGELRSFAERLLCTGEAAHRAEIVGTAAPALYQSTEDKDADEVAVTVRFRCETPEHGKAQGEDVCIGEIRRRLDAVGVPRR